MDDLISRRAAIDTIVTDMVAAGWDTMKAYEEGKHGKNAYLEGISDSLAVLRDLPSVQSERWIPVTERLPKDDELHIITVCDESGDRPYVYTSFGWYLEEANCWIVDNERRRDVTAWAVRPIPYKWRQ